MTPHHERTNRPHSCVKRLIRTYHAEHAATVMERVEGRFGGRSDPLIAGPPVGQEVVVISDSGTSRKRWALGFAECLPEANVFGYGSAAALPNAKEGLLMKIGIIGAGNIGATLTRRLSALGHQVAVANSRGPETLADLVRETGATAVSVEETAQGADLVIVTIPQRAIPLLPKGILDSAAAGAPVVDTGNYYPARDGRIDTIESGMAESRWVSEQLAHPIVKAFNTIRAQHLLERGNPAGSPDRIALPVAGDDPDGKRIVMRLVDELGFDPVDAGTIDESWRQQPGTPVYAADLDAPGVRKALAEATAERSEGFRA